MHLHAIYFLAATVLALPHADPDADPQSLSVPQGGWSSITQIGSGSIRARNLCQHQEAQALAYVSNIKDILQN